jgi:predicted kinase
MRILYIIRGIAGSGKSTLARTLVHSGSICEADQFFINQETGEYKFNPDEIKIAHQWCKDEVENRMKDNKENPQRHASIVVSNTFTQEWEMDWYFKLAEKYDYKVFSIIVENRHGGKNIHGVPDEKLEIMRRRFEIQL